jgi:hypothetical protein
VPGTFWFSGACRCGLRTILGSGYPLASKKSYRWFLNGRFSSAAVEGAVKRQVKTPTKAARVAAGKAGAKSRWNPKRLDVKRAIRKRQRKEWEALKRRDAQLKQRGRAEWIRDNVSRDDFRTSKDGTFRWREIDLPDGELDTLRYAVGRVSGSFKYPVTVTFGVKGYDKDGRPVGRPPNNMIWGKQHIPDRESIVVRMHEEIKKLMERYLIDLVGQIKMHVSEDRQAVKVKKPVKGKTKSKKKGVKDDKAKKTKRTKK